MEKYPYASEDRMASPHSYMYTPFIGSDFFAAYAASREQGIAFCEHSMPGITSSISDDMAELYDRSVTELLKAHAPFRIRQAPVLPPRGPLPDTGAVSRHPQGRFRTEDLLEGLLFSGNSLADDLLRYWLEWFVHRFEVGKALRETYSLTDRTLDSKSAKVRPYALLAALLARSCDESGDLKHLNTLLKLDDLLCSVMNVATFSGDDVVLTSFALMVERRVVWNLCVQKDVL